ncbi:MAG: hypothetical protein ACK5B9_00415 [Flavobacteriia bacterium]|jgi:uncharacterized membrane protein
MAKQTRIQKQIHLQNSQGKGYQQEQLESFDDNLLPEANEIKELFILDSDILTWLKKRAEKEQDFRHDLIQKKASLLESEIKYESRNTFIGLFFAFFIIISGMALSAFLIYQKHVVTGTIFSGITIITSATLFLKKTLNFPERDIPNKEK